MARTIRSIFLSMFLAMGATVAHAEVQAPAPPGSDRTHHAWSILHDLETVALRTYRHHLATEAEQLGTRLWDVAHSPDLAALPSCGRAAETLSYMLMGFASSARKIEIAADWHHFAPRYAEQRSGCLATLKLDAGEYPLPFWFGR